MSTSWSTPHPALAKVGGSAVGKAKCRQPARSAHLLYCSMCMYGRTTASASRGASAITLCECRINRQVCNN